jgi:hypothetical protein
VICPFVAGWRGRRNENISDVGCPVGRPSAATQVVGGELQFVALRAEPARGGRDPGIVDQHVKRGPLVEDGIGEPPHGIQVGQVKHADLNLHSGHAVGDLGGGR